MKNNRETEIQKISVCHKNVTALTQNGNHSFIVCPLLLNNIKLSPTICFETALDDKPSTPLVRAHQAVL